MGEVRVPAERYWGAQTQRADRALPHRRRALPLHAAADPRARAREESGSRGERRARRAACGQGRAHRPRRPGGRGRPARRRVPAGRLPDRLGHADEHERQRGHRRPRQRARGRGPRHASSRSIPTTTSIAASRRTTPSRRRCTSPSSRRSRRTCSPRSKDYATPCGAEAADYDDVVMVGRTHLQDATPVTLGQVIGGWASQLDHALHDVRSALPGLHGLALGGTAVGTGLNAHPRFAETAIGKLAAATGTALPPGARLLRRAVGSRRAGGGERRVAHPRRRSHEDRQRRALVRLGSARRPRRAPHPRERAGLVDHAGQGEPDGGRGAHPGGGPGLRQRRTPSASPASQGNFQLNVYKPVIVHNVLESLAAPEPTPCRAFDRFCAQGLAPQPPRHRASSARFADARHGAQPAHRLREGGGDRAARAPRRARRCARPPSTWAT